jgi:sigma-B regulation protein RsbU (phosphoserine phosphatase)
VDENGQRVLELIDAVRSSRVVADWSHGATEVARVPEQARGRSKPITTRARNESQEIERLRTLVEASKLINSSIEPREIYRSILSLVRQELKVDRGTLYFVDDRTREIWANIAPEAGIDEIRLPIGKGLAGWVAETGEHVILDDAQSDPRFDPSHDRRSGFVTRAVLCVPIKNRVGRVVGVLQLLNKKDADFGREDLEFLASVSDHMAIAIENATVHIQLLVKERMERELSLGREIQSQLLPPVPLGVPGTELAATTRACFEVGGDYFDFIALPSGELGLVIGDVSGKGVGAAIVTSSVQAALRAAAQMECDLGRLMALLNGLLLDMTRGLKYVTLFFGCYSPLTGRLRYVNAGHNAPLLFSGPVAERLGATGRPIGLLRDSVFREESRELGVGAVLLLYTDGLSEATNPDEEEFGADRLRDVARHALAAPTSRIPDELMDAVSRFEAGAAQADDKTVVVLRRTA